MRAFYTWFGIELYDMLTARLNLVVRLLKTDLMKTLLYGGVTWTLNTTHKNNFRKAHLGVLRRVLGFRRRAHHTNLSYAKSLNKRNARERTSGNKEDFIPLGNGTTKQGANFSSGVMFAQVTGGPNPGPGGPPIN